MKCVHFILQGKGGVGKTLIASHLAQYLTEKELEPHCYDTDPVNQSFAKYEALNVTHIQLLNGAKVSERNFDLLIENLINDDGVSVVDNGASSFIPLSNYIIENDVFALLEKSGVSVYVHCVVTGGQAMIETLQGLGILTKQVKAEKNIVWLNEFFGYIEAENKQFSDMKVYTENKKNIHGIVTIAKRNHDTFGLDVERMTKTHLTFNEAIASGDFSLMAKHRLALVKNDIYAQLEKLIP